MKILKDIQGKEVSKDFSSFYHGFVLEDNAFKNMITEGIKCRSLLGLPGEGYNGLYYISLTKMIDNPLSTHYLYSSKGPMFIIDSDVAALKCRVEYIKMGLENSILPFRGSIYPDEYQVYNLIEASKILGIEFDISSFSEENKLNALKALKSMVLVLDSLGKEIPIYDYGALREINKESVLKLL